MVYQIKISSCDKYIRRLAVDISALIGFSGKGIPKNIITDDEGIYSTIEIKAGLLNLEEKNGNYVLSLEEENYKEAIKLVAKEIFGYQDNSVDEFIYETDVEHTFFKVAKNIKADSKFRRKSDFKIYVDDLPDDLLKLAALYTARLFMDVDFIDLPITANKKKDSDILIEKGAYNKLEFGKPVKLFVKNDKFFQSILLNRNLEKTNFLVEETFGPSSFEMQFVKACAMSKNVYLEKCPEHLIKNYQREFPDIKLNSYKDKEDIKSFSFDYPWEIDVLKEKIDRLTKNDKKVKKIEAAVSEPKNIRDSLKQDLNKNKKFEETEIQIINSYKQGFSWIEEYVIKKLKDIEIDRIEIGWNAFQKEDEEWTTEEGAVPSYVNTGVDNHGKWYDLPIRYLQELYPIDDLIEKELDINRDDVEFILDKNDNYAYEFRAFRNNKLVFSEKLDVIFSERNYIDAYPGMGLVHPSTGYVKLLYEDGSEEISTFKTDLENIWNDYQQVLVEIGNEILDKGLKSEDQPFFAELHMDINVSEEDRKLGIREDTISSIDGFHEDLYFVGLDYFKVLGEQNNCGTFDSPGLILPEIHNVKGNPNFTCTLRKFLDSKPYVLCGDEKKYLEFTKPDVLGFIEKDEKIYLWIKIDLLEDELSILKRILKIGGSKLGELEIDGIIVNDEVCEIASNSSIEKKVPDINLNVLNYLDSEILLNNLKSKVEVSYLGKSYMGRYIKSIDLYCPTDLFESTHKAKKLRPTIYINARHHANEVSSTNSSFMLANEVLENSNLVEDVNLIIIPMENPDGSEIHYKLMEEHPNWIFHIARFNALGKEFGHEYFKEDTIHTEALPMSRVFYKFLPDIYIDDHGVPTHEWNQQFSGYTAPSYKGFWLPRSLLYGYFWYPKEEKWQKNIKLAKEMQDAVAEGINSDARMKNLNLEWKNRFEKYAHSWMPKMFPTGYYKDMIFYWIPFETDRTHRYLSIRHPEITVIGYTSEVIDETAQGEFLKLCAEAHLKHNISVIKFLSQKDIVIDKYIEEYEAGIRIQCERRRTL